ncbi:cytochrome d ubiquinol oxidase subunit II [Streptomyces sp. GD-15H]|uniref:cytochrome d ubiquinol oxidase subunit II n=1 Tax=Streptomyces sp. GD-15H TaxID=3129112 RepID=UPI003256862A
MDVLWLCVLGLMLGGWFVLDGFVIGSGLLLRRLGRTPGERRTVLAAVGPYFLAGEVWLVVSAGVLITAYPELEKSTFTAFRPVVVVLVCCWALRSASMWFRARRPDESWRRRWELLLAVSSAGFAASWGLFLGNLAQGLPETSGQVSSGTLFGLVPVLCAAAVPMLLAVHGAAFTAARTTGELSRRAAAEAKRLVVPVLVLLGAAVAAGVPLADGVTAPWAAVTVAAAGAAAVACAGPLLGRGSTAAGFALTAFAVTTPLLSVGAGTAPSLTGLAAPAGVLDSLSVLLLPALAVVVLVQMWVLWLFRHRVDKRTIAFF